MRTAQSMRLTQIPGGDLRNRREEPVDVAVRAVGSHTDTDETAFIGQSQGFDDLDRVEIAMPCVDTLVTKDLCDELRCVSLDGEGDGRRAGLAFRGSVYSNARKSSQFTP